MKSTILTLVFVLTAVLTCMAKGKVIKNLSVEYTPNWISAYEAELSDEATILRCKLGSDCRIMSNSMLVDRKTGKEYKLIKVEGVAIDQWIHTSDGSRSDCALFFEPVGKDVKEVNYIERETVKNNPDQQMYGISLVPTAKKAKVKSQPSKVKAQQSTAPDTAWRFSNERYKDMRFYNSGKARLNIHIERIPKELREMASKNVFSLQYEEQVLRKKTMMSAKLDENDCVVFDLNLPGPTFVGIETLGYIFMQPNDTLDVFTTLETKDYLAKYIRYEGNSETAQINTLLPELMETILGKKEPLAKYSKIEKTCAEGKESVENLASEWGNKLDSIATSESVRKMLQAATLSVLGKDLTMLAILTDIAVDIEDLVDNYGYRRHIREQKPDVSYTQRDDSTWIPLDNTKVYAPLLKHKALLYDNPLVLSNYDQWVFINRTMYSHPFFSYDIITDEHGKTYGIPLDKYGLSDTFMWNLRKSQNIASSMQFKYSK
ncbi:MAG: hypothetical protein HUK05_08155 [Prevotella sp.]|nr:hypothetical protein [Prevotella sp.]